MCPGWRRPRCSQELEGWEEGTPAVGSRVSPVCDSLWEPLPVGADSAPQYRRESQALDPMVFTGVFLSPIHWGQVSHPGQ